MAIADYDPLAVPAGCVDSPDVNQWLQNLNGLMEASLQGTGGVTCVPVVGSLADGECFTLDSSSALRLSRLEQTDGVIEKKIFLVPGLITIEPLGETITGTTPGFPASINQQIYYTITAKCNGITVASSGIKAAQAGQQTQINLNMVGECVAGVPVEICFAVVGDSIPSNYERPLLLLQLCGAVLCVAEASRGFIDDIPGFMCAPNVPEGCKIGREGIHLMQQNTRALCAYAAQGYLESACDFSASFNDSDSHILAQPTSDVQYLIVGSATICAFNNGTNLPVVVTAQITGGCSNGSTITCLPGRIVLERTGSEGGAGAQQCFSVPFVACGNCLAGGNIFAGIDTSTVCGDSDSNLTAPGGVITGVTQQYTLFTFRRVDPIAEGLLPVFQEQPIDKCIARKSVEYLVEKADSLFDYFCARLEKPAGCTNIASGFGPSSGGVVYSDIIRPASPPPPVTVPPTPIPTSKTNIMCTVVVCMTNLFRTIAQIGTIEITISCPGAPSFIYTRQCYLPAPERETSDNFEQVANPTTCKSFPLIHTYSGCLITQPVTFEVSVTSQNIEVVGSVQCFSYNI